MNITVSYDLANFIMYLLGAVLIVVVIITFININKFIKRLDKLVEQNEDNINRTAKTVPEIANNVNDVTVGVKKGVDRIGEAMDAVESSICDTIVAVTEGTEGLLDFVGIVGEIFKVILKIFPLGKKK
ncbi:MAG: DUF948 domain-containing protein [Clostridium sp.]|nr:DUF948 domain-containing protein [Clostridium sp.]